MIVHELLGILSLSIEKERFQSTLLARSYPGTMVYNHVHCNSLYPGRATYFYPRAVNFFALYARRELWFSGTTVIVSYDSRTEVMNGSGSRGTDVTIPSADGSTGCFRISELLGVRHQCGQFTVNLREGVSV